MALALEGPARARCLAPLGLLLGLSGEARAADAPVDVSWSAPPQCPGISELLRRVEGFLGQPLHAGRQQMLAISGSVTRSEQAGFTAALTLTNERGSHERKLEHSDCVSLVEGAALIMALAIDPERVEAQAQRQRESGGEPSPALVEATPAAPPSPPPPSPAPASVQADWPRPTAIESKAQQGPRFLAALVGLGGAGTLPGFGTGAGLGLALDWSWFRAAGVGRYWLPRVEPVDGDARAAVSLELVTAGLRGCALPLDEDFVLATCGGIEIGDMSGNGEAVDQARTRHDRWSGLTLGVELSYGKTALVPVAGVEGGLALERPRFGVLENGREREVFRPSPWAVQGYLGLAARMP